MGAPAARRISTLKANPQRCPVDPDSEAYGEEVRVLLHGTYRVLFVIRGETVRVLTVRHSAQRSLADELAEVETEDEGPRAH